MKRSIKYTASKTPEELQDFCKLNYHIEDEIWKSITFDVWEDFKISNYGRLYNTKTNKFRKCTMSGKKCDINSILFINTAKINKKYISRSKTICDLMLHAFYPDIFDTHINPIPIDGNIFNLDLNNIMYVPNSCYEGDKVYKKVFIYINGEKSENTIDTDGIIIDENTGMPRRSKYNKGSDNVSLRYKDGVYSHTRTCFMAEAFISNPNNLRNAVLIDPKNTKLSLDNICWTNRHRLVSR